MASKLTIWRKGGRFITGLVVACFFLPFFGVSCQGFDIVNISGADMIAGCKIENAAGPKLRDSSAAEDGGKKSEPKVDIEPLAIIAFACTLIAFGLAWVRSRGALIGTMVVALAGVGALAGLYVKVKGNLDDAVKAEVEKKKQGDGGDIARDLINLDVGGRMGLWITALGLLGIAALTGMAAREKDGVAGGGAAPPPPQQMPPPGYPPAGYPPQQG